jgi:hypothetical protein
MVVFGFAKLTKSFFFFGFEETPPPEKRTLWAQMSE